jgi:hypothetical protein
LRELYQEVILEHSKKPKNFRVIETANHKAEGFNPLCGDHFTVYVDVTDGAINDIGFQGRWTGTGQACCFRRRFRVSASGKVRHFGLACAASGTQGRAGSGFN